MTNLKKRTLSLVVLSFYGVILLFSFQNCGVKGFDIDPSLIRGPNSENQALPTNDHGTTDLTTIPSGKMLEFKMPSQMQKLAYSHIDIIDGKNYGYSNTLRKFISFYSDSDSYEVIEIPDRDVFLIKSILQAAPLGYQEIKNLKTFLVFFSDDKFKLGYGIFNIKDKTWNRIRLPDFDPIQNIMNNYYLDARILSNPVSNLTLLLLRKTLYSPIGTTQTSEYYQAFDNSGRSINELTLIPSGFRESFYSNLTPVNPFTLVSISQKTSIDLKSGTIKSLSPAIASYSDKIFKQDLSGVLYLENNSITEFDFVTQTSRKILAPADFYFSNLRKITDTFYIFENSIPSSSSQSKYLLRTNNLAPLPISTNTFSYASTTQNLVLFSSDPLANDFKIQIRVINNQTQKEVSICSELAPLDTQLLDMNQSSSNFTSFFPNNLRFPKNINPTATSIAMDKTCSNLYLGFIYLSSDYSTQMAQLYKYNISTAKTQLVFESSSPKGTSTNYFTFLGFKNDSLVFRFKDSIFSTDNKEELGTYYSSDSYLQELIELRKFNYSNFKIVSDNNKVLDFITSSEGNIALLKENLKIKSQPNSYVIPLVNNKYMIISREKDQDTLNSSSIGLYFYNENDTITSKKSINVASTDVTLGIPLKYFDPSDSTNSFQAFTILGSLNGQDQNYFLIINTTDLSYKIISRPKDMNNGLILKDGNIISTKYLCKTDSNQCLENPFSLQKEASFNYVNDFFTLTMYQNDLITIQRYEYDVNKKSMALFDTQLIDLNIYNTNYILTKTRLLLNKKGAEIWIVKNLLVGNSFELNQPVRNFNPISNDIFYGTVVNTTTSESSPWILDLRQETEGKIDVYPLKDETGKIISSTYLTGYDTLLLKANSDYIGVVAKKEMDVNYYVWSLNQKKNLKVIIFDRDFYIINLSNSEILFQTKNFDSNGKKLLKFTWLDLNTMKTYALELPQYQKVSCSPSYRKFDYTLCTGLIDNQVQLLYWNSQKHSFDILSENIPSNLSINGFLSISKNLALINFKELSNIQAPADIINLYPEYFAEISTTSLTFFHRK